MKLIILLQAFCFIEHFLIDIFSFFKKGKISLFSRYERVTDRRTFKDRRDVFAIAREKKLKEVEKPKAKIKNTGSGESQDYNRKPRNKKTDDEAPKEDGHEEEQHHEEEAPAAEEPEAEEHAEEEEEEEEEEE